MRTAERTISSVMNSCCNANWKYIVYDDFSDEECASKLDEMAENLGFEVVHLANIISSPSPNYRYVLQSAQQSALENDADLVIIESDVVIKPDTIANMMQVAEKTDVGMVAAVTVDADDVVNFPYLYASKYSADVSVKKRLSFCCTLLCNRFLKEYNFQKLNPEKQWYDVPISAMSRKLGFKNMLLISTRVLHTPHASRPWKLLKYSNPIKYYWYKFTRGMDKI